MATGWRGRCVRSRIIPFIIQIDRPIKHMYHIKTNSSLPAEALLTDSFCWLMVGTQKTSCSDVGLRFDERKLVASALSALY